MSTGGEILGPSQDFPEHVHSSEYVCVCVCPDSQGYVRVIHSPQRSHSLACPLKFFVSLLFVLTVIYYLSQQQLGY